MLEASITEFPWRAAARCGKRAWQVCTKLTTRRTSVSVAAAACCTLASAAMSHGVGGAPDCNGEPTDAVGARPTAPGGRRGVASGSSEASGSSGPSGAALPPPPAPASSMSSAKLVVGAAAEAGSRDGKWASSWGGHTRNGSL